MFTPTINKSKSYDIYVKEKQDIEDFKHDRYFFEEYEYINTGARLVYYDKYFPHCAREKPEYDLVIEFSNPIYSVDNLEQVSKIYKYILTVGLEE